MASGATCVQRLDGSRDSAIHTKYRISLRSSSMREPRYPLPRVVFCFERSAGSPARSADGARGTGCLVGYSLALFAPGFVSRPERTRARAPGTGRETREGAQEPTGSAAPPVRGSFCSAGFDNDPSAGSPTETLLRLLLPLNDKVQWTSRDVAGSEPPTSPRSEHFTGSFNR